MAKKDCPTRAKPVTVRPYCRRKGRAPSAEQKRALYLALYRIKVTGKTQDLKSVTAARVEGAKKAVKTMEERHAWAYPPSAAEIAEWKRLARKRRASGAGDRAAKRPRRTIRAPERYARGARR